ncbi:MAG: hypothetical protein CMD99_07975 [Gammaproteobacteria bacterium]|nr:hypothetical protein [Gammaproteobacteria bacterium]
MTPSFGDAAGDMCDRLASIAADPDHQAEPIGYSAIDGQLVINACGDAINYAPHNGRYWIQLGRGYLKLDQGRAMLAAFEKAKALKYPAAWFALAVVYHTGNGSVEVDLDRAESLYLEAYRRGIGYAALGLARLYDEAGSPVFDAGKAAIWQSRFDLFIN